MMEYTDRFDRYFLRLFSRHMVLYTEMVTTGAVIHGDRRRLLRFDPVEHPVVLQLGGSEPTQLAEAARIAEDLGYDEINLNVGCPSDRVKSGRFGACLMAQPELVAECVEAMVKAVKVPVTVKNRIGIDDQDDYEDLKKFTRIVAEAGCGLFVVHARKAWLQGLSPKENREIPPLIYESVYRLKEEMPGLKIIINGGITDLDQSLEHLQKTDGVMMGRAAYHNPYLLAEVDQRIYGEAAPVKSRHEILDAYLPFVEQCLTEGVPLKAISRHLLGLFHGVPGGKRWRRYLSENAYRADAGIHTLLHAQSLVKSGY